MAITPIFNRPAELETPIGILTNKANAELETQPLTVETKTRKCRK